MSVSHPLSNEQSTSRRRNPTTSPPTNYFSLKHASDERASGSGARQLPAALLVSPPADLGIHVEQEDSQESSSTTARPSDMGNTTPIPRTPIFTLGDGDEDPADQMVLSTRWHTLSDQEIQANIATLSSVQSPSDESTHPYHDTIRILSAACERLVRQAASLERARRSLQQQEARRKRAAERAVKELKPGQRDTGQQLLTAIYGLELNEVMNHATLNATKNPSVSLVIFVCRYVLTVP